MSDLFSLAIAIGLAAAPPPAPAALETGLFRAALDCRGGELPFGLEIAATADGYRATVINGSERIEVPHVALDGDALTLDFDHYDSSVRAVASDGGRALDGTWRKRRGPDLWCEMPFHARRAAAAPPQPAPPAGTAARFGAAGRWAVRFSSSDDAAVGVFAEDGAGGLSGTFLTTTGDYRFLAGRIDGRRLRLSCFDGAHAFLFVADGKDDGTLAGDFWSGDSWHETWTAARDPDASLPDPLALSRWTDGLRIQDLAFPDPDGKLCHLGDPRFAGRARILEVFGTWCPNCNDEAPYLAELDRRYRSRGLSIVGLAFELTGDPARDGAQVRRFAARHGVDYPILLAGVSDKARATESFRALDRIRAYPTTIFLHGDGRVRAVYTGYSGPATGPAHDALRARFEEIIEELLGEPPGGR